MDNLFDTTKEDIVKMTWDEIQELINFMIRNKLYDNFVEYLGKPPHVIKHDHFIEEMNKNKEVDGDDVAKVLGHMDEDGKFITGHEIPL